MSVNRHSVCSYNVVCMSVSLVYLTSAVDFYYTVYILLLHGSYTGVDTSGYLGE